MLPDAGHGQRMQRLQQQRPDPADIHRGVALDPADRVVGREATGSRRQPDRLRTSLGVRPGDPVAQGPRQPAAGWFERGGQVDHAPSMARAGGPPQPSRRAVVPGAGPAARILAGCSTPSPTD
ncbi:hypothetical protein [Ornithinimicrobium kibberense]|uniref:hypothetical protein n=1 Tax=Ornithinimicrobium kibberense TaxID=282060 RepID=UPI00360EA679